MKSGKMTYDPSSKLQLTHNTHIHLITIWMPGKLVCIYAAVSCNDMITVGTCPAALDEQSQLGKSVLLKDYSIHLMTMCFA